MPPESALLRKLRGPTADWTLEALLLRLVSFQLAGANWQRSGGKSQKPKIIPLPNETTPAKRDVPDVVQQLKNLNLLPAAEDADPPAVLEVGPAPEPPTEPAEPSPGSLWSQA